MRAPRDPWVHARYAGHMSRYDPYVAELSREFPGLRVLPKERSALQRLIDLGLRVVTLGAMRTYLTEYTTVIGRTIYVPVGWDARDDDERYITMRHEAVHLRQMRRYTTLGMGLLYALPLFPLGLAYGRARIEWEAYAETLRAVAEVRGVKAARDPKLRAHVVRQFTSAAYGWMWPFPATVERWIDEELARIGAGTMGGAPGHALK